MDDSVAIEPVRWDELHRALGLVATSAGLMLIGCGLFSLPVLIHGGILLVKWAPNRAVKRPAQLLVVTGIVDATLVLAFMLAVVFDETDRLSSLAGPMVVLGLVAFVLLTVGWILTYRNLCVWAAATLLVADWDRTIRRLPIAAVGIVGGTIGVVVANQDAFAILVLIAGLWALCLLAYPTGWTNRMFTADPQYASRFHTRVNRRLGGEAT